MLERRLRGIASSSSLPATTFLFKGVKEWWENMSIRKKTVRREEKERKKIEMEIEIQDFGPISGGKIKLKPLTLFIGPNNSGKSYAAMLIHSIFESTPTALPERYFSIRHGNFFVMPRTIGIFIARKEIRELIRQIGDLKEGEEIGSLKEGKELEVSKQLIEIITNKIFEEMYENRLSNEIIRSFACPLNELIRIGKTSFTLRIRFDSYNTYLILKNGKLKVKDYPQLDCKIRVKAIGSHQGTIKIDERENEILVEIGGFREIEMKKLMSIDAIFNVCFSRILRNIAIPCYYLPAARSGILQGHKALAASIVKKVPYVGIERLEIPRFSGVVSDFLSSIITLPEEKGPFYQLAQDFEKELIKGEVVVRTLDEYLYPEIKYNFQGTEIPLHRASSTVSELAPLSLYLKYIIQPNSVLIIEEPEAHLHPENQRILAKFLVKLVRRGVNIVITTHSEYLLEQLSSFILLSKVEPKKRLERYKYHEEDFIKPDEVAAYVFRYDAMSAGHKISEVEITEEYGISQEEFLKIHEALYEETIKLRRDLSVET
jgi:predicted ATPase